MKNNIQGNSHQVINISQQKIYKPEGNSMVYEVMKGKNLQPRILYPADSLSDLMEVSKSFQTSNSVPPNQP